MTLLDIAFACVFVVPYNINGESWRVRIKVEPYDDKEVISVVHAFGPEDQEITGEEWDNKVIEADLLSEFWAAVLNYMLLTRLDPKMDLGPVGDA